MCVSFPTSGLLPDRQAVISGKVTGPGYSDVRPLVITWHPSGHDHLLGLPPHVVSK